jgi:peptide/nickel transport system substrate-binding protein
VRRAISFAIDRRRIVAVAVHGYGEPSSDAIPSTHPFATTTVPTLDTARADSLLDAVGWHRGTDGSRHRGNRTLSLELLTVGSSDNAAEQLIQSDLARIGIRVDIRQRELASFLAEARATPRRFDALYTGIPGDLSLSYLSAMFDSRFAGGALDYAGFHDPRLDSLLASARAAPDTIARARWSAVERELDASMPVAWIYHARGVQGASRRLQGVTMDLRGELATLASWYVATARDTAAAP